MARSTALLVIAMLGFAAIAAAEGLDGQSESRRLLGIKKVPKVKKEYVKKEYPYKAVVEGYGGDGGDGGDGGSADGIVKGGKYNVAKGGYGGDGGPGGDGGVGVKGYKAAPGTKVVGVGGDGGDGGDGGSADGIVEGGSYNKAYGGVGGDGGAGGDGGDGVVKP